MTIKPNGSPAPGQLYDLREWLMSQIDGSEETRGDDGLISDFIRQIDALPSEMGATVEPRGCPTPGSCSAVEELADLKQRLLPQFQGRAQRAERDRDAMQQLIAARSATAATDRPDWAQQLPGAELYDRDHGYDRTASLNEGRYVCTCGACSHYDAQQLSHTTGEASK